MSMTICTPTGSLELPIPPENMAYSLENNHLVLEMNSLDRLHIRKIGKCLQFDYGDIGNPVCTITPENAFKGLDLFITPHSISFLSSKHDKRFGAIRDTLPNREALAGLPKMFEDVLGELLTIKVNSAMIP